MADAELRSMEFKLRFSARDPDAIDVVISKFLKTAYVFAQQRVSQDAEDVVQDAFSKLISCASEYDPSCAEISTFFFARCLMPAIRKRWDAAKTKSITLDPEAIPILRRDVPDEDPKTTFQDELLATLTDDDAFIAKLYLFDGDGGEGVTKQIVEQFGCTPEAARKRSQRLRERVRDFVRVRFPDMHRLLCEGDDE